VPSACRNYLQDIDVGESKHGAIVRAEPDVKRVNISGNIFPVLLLYFFADELLSIFAFMLSWCSAKYHAWASAMAFITSIVASSLSPMRHGRISAQLQRTLSSPAT
jgi:hypothetical protein